MVMMSESKTPLWASQRCQSWGQIGFGLSGELWGRPARGWRPWGIEESPADRKESDLKTEHGLGQVTKTESSVRKGHSELRLLWFYLVRLVSQPSLHWIHSAQCCGWVWRAICTTQKCWLSQDCAGHRECGQIRECSTDGVGPFPTGTECMLVVQQRGLFWEKRGQTAGSTLDIL